MRPGATLPLRCFRPSAALDTLAPAGPYSPPNMRIETDVNLKAYNTFGLPATAGTLIRIYNDADIDALLAHPVYGPAPKLVLGSGSNLSAERCAPGNRPQGGDHGAAAVCREEAGCLDRGGRCRGRLVRAGGLDPGPGLAGAGESGPDSRYGGRRTGAEHRRLRRGTPGAFRFPGCRGSARRPPFQPGCRGLPLRLSRQPLQTRIGRRLPDYPGAAEAAQAVASRADRIPTCGGIARQVPMPSGSSMPSAPCAGPSCPIPSCWAAPAAFSRIR